MATATLSATQLLPLSLPKPSQKLRHAHFPFQSLNPSSRVFSSNGFVSNYSPIQAILNSTPITTEAGSEQEPFTLRQICQSHVPDHVLCRMEELGFVVPTPVQRQALPTLFSGRDCILHAQVKFVNPFIFRCFWCVSVAKFDSCCEFWSSRQVLGRR